MPRKAAVVQDSFLRSIDLLSDCDVAERIAHFRPTTKGLAVLRALSGKEADRAFLVIAPYGTGKSIVATYLLHVVENRPESRSALATIGNRLKAVDPTLGEYAENRRQAQKTSGIVLALSGHYKSLPAAIREAALTSMKRLKLARWARRIREHEAATIQDAIQILKLLEGVASRTGRDQIVVLWDEFGQHVQTLISEGRPQDLVHVQKLAEYMSRRANFQITLGLLLHQSLIRFSRKLSSDVRSEWKKIEGRFRTIQYVDDSRETYELIADVVESVCNPGKSPKGLLKLARESKELGLFREFKVRELSQLFRRAYPLEPTTLYLLPRLAARVAQNERTLFSFVHDNGLTAPVSPDCLFDYFSGEMQTDTVVGGTYKQWVETKSALTKIGDHRSEKALKMACLLGLGLSGQRTRTSTGLLRFAMRGFATVNGKNRVIADLVDSKLLLHRKHSDEISVWHGPDTDLRKKVDERKSRKLDEFNVVEFLTEKFPAPVWKPVEYNGEFHMLRYFTGTYHTLESFETWAAQLEMTRGLGPDGPDGEIAYICTNSKAESDRARDLTAHLSGRERVLVAISPEISSLQGDALEVQCLTEMQHEADLINDDPFILPMLHELRDDSVKHLERTLQRILSPSPNGPEWFHCGKSYEFKSASELRNQLTLIMREVFPYTPKINSEAIVRHKPTRIMVNARKKLLLGILERYGQENLGIEGRFPDSSMFRSVLLNTGLYRKINGQWKLVLPTKARLEKDDGLRLVWMEIRDFFEKPQERPKRPADLFNKLMSPPFGVRQGLLPIFFSAGLKRFSRALSITKDGEYLGDILPTGIEDLCREPHKYRVKVVDLSPNETDYLLAMIECLGGQPPAKDGDLVRKSHDAFQEWRQQLPPAAMSTRKLSAGALELRNLMKMPWDPARFFLKDIPSLELNSAKTLAEVARQFSVWVRELEISAGVYVDAAAHTIREVLDLPVSDSTQPVVDLANRWAGYFSPSLLAHLGPGVEKALIELMNSSGSKSEGEFVDQVSGLVINRRMARWNDSTTLEFERSLGGFVARLERFALAQAELGNGTGPSTIAGLLEARLTRLRQRQERMESSNG